MNLIERMAIKLLWRRTEDNMSDKAKRYLPLAGSAVLVTVVLLRLFGYGQAAAAVETVGGIVGVTQQSPVGVGELAAAIAAASGVVLKVIAEVKKARG